MAGFERFCSFLLPCFYHCLAALSKLSLILHCYFPNRFSANFRQILLFSSLFIYQYFPDTSTSSSDFHRSLLRSSPPRSPSKTQKRPKAFCLESLFSSSFIWQIWAVFCGWDTFLSSSLEKLTHSAKQSWHKLIIGNAVNCDRLMAKFERFCSFLRTCFRRHWQSCRSIRASFFVHVSD